jgi:hypothetical protein
MSIKSFGILLALAASAFAQTTVTRTTDYTFPVVGLGSTETIGVNLINLAANSSTGTVSSCTGSVTFYNAAGTAIGSASNFSLAANAAASVNLPFSSSGIGGSRGLIRTVVASTTTSNIPCSLSYSLNTFDTSSGVTHLFLIGPAAASAPVANPGH